MDIQRFIDNFQLIASAPSGIVQIKRLILIIAIQGKLVKQDLKDKSSFGQIQLAKETKLKLMKEKKIKSENPLSKISQDEISYDVPSNWSITRIGEILTVVRGASPRPKGDPRYFSKDRTEYHWVKISDINKYSDGWLLQDTDEFLTEEGSKHSVVLEKGTLVLTNSATVGLPVVLGFEGGCIHDGYLAFPFLNQEVILQKFLYYYFLYFREELEARAYGMAQVNINTKIVRAAPITLPPIEEQKNIIVKIEELLARCNQLDEQQKQLDEIKIKTNNSLINSLVGCDRFEHLKNAWDKFDTNFADLLCTIDNIEILKEAIKTLAVLGKLEKLINNSEPENIIDESVNNKKQLIRLKKIKRESLLPSVRHDELGYAYPSQWAITKFDNLANITGGITKGRKFKDRKISNYPFLRVANVQRGYFLLNDIHEIEIPIDEYDRYVLKEGDILITEGGDWDKVGRTAIWKGQLQDCLHQNHVFKARMFSERIEKEWIELVFNSSFGRQYWIKASKQTTNLASINMTQVRSFPVPVPSQEEQKRILYKLGRLLSICDELIDKIKKSQEVQENFSKAAIHSILHNRTNVSVLFKDQPEAKRFKRLLNVEIRLVSSMENNLLNTNLSIILKSSGGQMEAKELWKASKLKDIDTFYALLKQEIDNGLIQEPDIAELKLVEIDE
ncbi:restriction endonuclease subunit S [Nostoc sp.]|uniref:restriction endonuclease subunit S n=1 Tax=Nostoc sp. TaxID=1180 RepID=UPI002FF5D86E